MQTSNLHKVQTICMPNQSKIGNNFILIIKTAKFIWQSVGKLLADILQTLAAKALVGIARLHICPCTNRQRNTDTLAQGIVRTHKRRSAPRTTPLNRLYRYIHSTTFFATKIGKKVDIGKLSG